MANISSTYGRIEFYADRKQVIENLHKLMILLDDNCDYYTAMQPLNNIVEDVEVHKCWAEVDFDGCGRWEYANNIDCMFGWIENRIQRLDDIKKDEYLNIVKILEMNSFDIVFDYIDYEPGFDMLKSAKVNLVHQKDEPLTASVMTCVDSVDHDITVVNMCKYMGYFVTEAIEELSYRYDEDILEVLEEQRDEIEEYAGCSLEEILGDR